MRYLYDPIFGLTWAITILGDNDTVIRLVLPLVEDRPLTSITEALMADGTLDTKDAAIAALVNLVRLMGAELVAGRHRDSPDLLEQAVRAKIAAFGAENCAADVKQAGIDLALGQVDHALKQIRAQRAAIDENAPPAIVSEISKEHRYLH